MENEWLNNIKTLRERAGLSQNDMAEKLNISQSAYSKLEKGITRMNEFYLHKLPEILGCTLFEIVGESYFKNYHVQDLPEKSIAEENETMYYRNDLRLKLLEQENHLLKKALEDKDEIIRLLKESKKD